MKKKVRAVGSSLSPAGGATLGPQGEEHLVKRRVNPEVHTDNGDKPTRGGGATSDGTDARDTDAKVVQFSILYNRDEDDTFTRLWATRDVMHRMLNVAMTEHARADKVVSSRLDMGAVRAAVEKNVPALSGPKAAEAKQLIGALDPAVVATWLKAKLDIVQQFFAQGRKRKSQAAYIDALNDIEHAKRLLSLTGLVTDERGPVTDAVLAVLKSNRDYWQAQIAPCLAVVQRLQVDLGRARAQNDTKTVAEIEGALKKAQESVQRARIRATTQVPSAVYDSVVQFTGQRFAVYKKTAFRGERTMDTFDAGQPIRWRTGSWALTRDKQGHYRLALPLDGAKGIATFAVVPDGPGMHGYAKQMVDPDAIARGDVKLCDARVVWADRKKQWFAKLSITRKRLPAPVAGAQVAALRRGINSAFVIAFEKSGGPRQPLVWSIDGGDVLAFKRQIKARKMSLQRHLNKLELGPSALGRGKARRYKGLRKIDDAEDRFVDARCRKWAAEIAAECATRGVGRLLVAKMSGKDMSDGDGAFRALLYQWPFAKMLDKLRQACEWVPVDAQGRGLRGKIRREPAGHRRVVVEEFDPVYDARRCPDCDHVHDKRPVFFTEAHGTRTHETPDGPQDVREAVRLIGTFKCEVCSF